jgi:hypothetical protein
MPLNLNNVSITIPSDVVTQLKQVFLPTDDERVKFAEATDSKAIAQELIDMHGAPLINSIIDIGGTKFAADVAEQIDTGDLARDIADRVDTSDIADHIDTSELTAGIARAIDLSDLADELANKIDASDIAESFSSREIAGELDAADIASELDIEEIASNVEVNDDVVAREFVRWLTNNSDGMRHFVDAFCRAYVEAMQQAVKS